MKLIWQLLTETLTIIIPLTAMMMTLIAWLRQEIKAQGERLDKRIDEQGKDIRTLIFDVAALKATVETFFRVRIDPQQPPDNPGGGEVNKAA